MVSVSWLAAVLSWFDTLRDQRQSQLQRAALITNPPNREQIMKLDKDGQGVSRLEFVVGYMMLLGVELCGEPLKWDDILPFIKLFDKYDVDNTKRITTENLKAYITELEHR